MWATKPWLGRGQALAAQGMRAPTQRSAALAPQAYTAIEQSFPTSARNLLESLQRRLQRRLQRGMLSMNMSISAATELLAENRTSSLTNSLFSDDGELTRRHTLEAPAAERPAAPLTSRQRQVGSLAGLRYPVHLLKLRPMCCASSAQSFAMGIAAMMPPAENRLCRHPTEPNELLPCVRMLPMAACSRRAHGAPWRCTQPEAAPLGTGRVPRQHCRRLAGDSSVQLWARLAGGGQQGCTPARHAAPQPASPGSCAPAALPWAVRLTP
jgi:hypothetical protein